MVHGVDDRVCKASGILQAQVDLAVLRTVCDGKVRADEGLERIETEGHDLLARKI